jgi:hypothetical protein
MSTSEVAFELFYSSAAALHLIPGVVYTMHYFEREL